MVSLHLGVTEIPYRYPARRGRRRAAQSKTTGDVAEILEGKYHLMETYLARHESFIQSEVEDAIEGSHETLLMGGPASTLARALAGATSAIEHDFKRALSLREFDGAIPGVPTAVSLRGVSHRFQRPYVRRASRPSFVDTGTYQGSFRVWVT